MGLVLRWRIRAGREVAPYGLNRGSLRVVLGALIAALALLMSAASAEPTRAQDVEPQIVGGTEVDNGKYPFMAALYDRSEGPPSPDTLHCGGTLIDSDSILTAAHCFNSLYWGNTGVTVGRTVLTDNNQGYVRGVSALYVHPMYEYSRKYDVAVLKLDAAVPAGIEPIRLADETQDRFEEPGRILTVTGWGNAEVYPVDQMRKATVPVVSDDEAAAAWNGGGVRYFYPPLMVAAGNGNRDTCQGDSGGPLFGRNEAGRFIQVGITNFGRGCASETHPGVYAEVNEPSIRSFILDAANR